MKKLSFAFISLFFIAVSSNAQTSDNKSHNVTLTLSNSMEIVFTSGASGVTMTFSTPTHYTSGVTADNAATLQVKSNKAYKVTVKAAAANFTSTATTTMPVNNVLYVKEAAQTSYVNLSTTDQDLLTNQSRGTNSFNVSYKATPGFSYDGGSYTVGVVYTATQL